MSNRASSKLLAGVADLHGRVELTDFTFIVKEVIFRVHRSILAAASPMMRSFFTGCNMTRSLNVDDIEPHIFKAMIRFIYTCEVPRKLQDIACELYAAAYHFGIESLKYHCLEQIQGSFSIEHALKTYYLAHKFGLCFLSAISWVIVKNDILELRGDYEQIPPGKVAEILELRKNREETEESAQDLWEKERSIIEQFEPKAVEPRLDECSSSSSSFEDPCSPFSSESGDPCPSPSSSWESCSSQPNSSNSCQSPSSSWVSEYSS